MPNYTVQATMNTFLYLDDVVASTEDEALEILLQKVSELVSQSSDLDILNISDFHIDNVAVEKLDQEPELPAQDPNYTSMASLLNQSQSSQETPGYTRLCR